jgi:hypothetical protein
LVSGPCGSTATVSTAPYTITPAPTFTVV